MISSEIIILLITLYETVPSRRTICNNIQAQTIWLSISVWNTIVYLYWMVNIMGISNNWRSSEQNLFVFEENKFRCSLILISIPLYVMMFKCVFICFNCLNENSRFSIKRKNRMKLLRCEYLSNIMTWILSLFTLFEFY